MRAHPIRATATRVTTLVASIALVLSVPSPTPAQIALEISPYVGLFLPTGDLARIDRASPGLLVPGIPPSTDIFEHETAAAFGARVTLWLTDRIGVEGVAAYSPGDLHFNVERGGTESGGSAEAAAVTLASARALVRVADDGAARVHLLGGLGIVSRSGEAFRGIEGRVDPAGVLGAGLQIELNPAVALRWDLEDYISWARLSLVAPEREFQNPEEAMDPGVDSDSRVQNDLVLSQTLTIRLGGL